MYILFRSHFKINPTPFFQNFDALNRSSSNVRTIIRPLEPLQREYLPDQAATMLNGNVEAAMPPNLLENTRYVSMFLFLLYSGSTVLVGFFLYFNFTTEKMVHGVFCVLSTALFYSLYIIFLILYILQHQKRWFDYVTFTLFVVHVASLIYGFAYDFSKMQTKD